MPIYIFIDELDRCRPTYAVLLLEAIKHIFGVSGFYFIVATNKTELSHSVKAIYGSEFDALTYLRRFFDQEYILPKPDNDKFASYLMKRFRFKSEDRLFTPIEASKLSSDTILDSIAVTFSLLATALDVSPRDQIQAAMQLKTIILTVKYNVIHVVYLIFIIMLRLKREDALHLFLTSNRTGGSVVEYDNLKKKNIEFEGHAPKEYGTSRAKISLVEVLEVYRVNASINSIELRKRTYQEGTIGNVYSKLQQEIPNSTQQNQHYSLTINEYPELVLQAGQLIL